MLSGPRPFLNVVEHYRLLDSRGGLTAARQQNLKSRDANKGATMEFGAALAAPFRNRRVI